MTLTIKPVTQASLGDLGKLFCTDAVAEACWCMWFIIPVTQFHAAGAAVNQASLQALAEKSELPLGLLAYRDGEPVGWCAAGPRSRYARALKTPTYKGGGPGDDDAVWMAPCIFISKDARGAGLSRSLLEAAVELARANGAAAIEGFPFTGSKRRSGNDVQVGYEGVFSACGFKVIRTPSPSRVVMRLDLK